MKRVVVTVLDMDEAELLVAMIQQAIQARRDGKHRFSSLCMGILADRAMRAVSVKIMEDPQ